MLIFMISYKRVIIRISEFSFIIYTQEIKIITFTESMS